MSRRATGVALAGVVVLVALCWSVPRSQAQQAELVVSRAEDTATVEETRGDLVVFEDVEVRGTRRGAVVVFDGDVVLQQGAHVYGELVVVGGGIDDRGAQVDGDQLALPNEALGEMLRELLEGGDDLDELIDSWEDASQDGRLALEEEVTVESDEEALGDIVVVGDDASIKGKAYGSVIVLNGKLTVDDTAEIMGDVLVLAGTLRVDEGASVRGTTLAIKSPRLAEMVDEALKLAEASERGRGGGEAPGEATTRVVVIGGQRWQGVRAIERGQVVHGDVVVTRGDLTIEGTVQGSAVAVLGSITLLGDAHVQGEVTAVMGEVSFHDSARVSGNCIAVFGDVTLRDSSRVDGDAIVVGGKLSRHGDSRVRGDTVQVHVPFMGAVPHGPDFREWWVAKTFLAGFLALACLILLPRRVSVIEEAVKRDPGAAFGWGFIGWILLLPVSLLTCCFMPLYWVWTFALWVLGVAALNLLIGRLILGQRAPLGSRVIVPAGIGLLAFAFAQLIGHALPVVGGLVVIGLSVGVGCLALGGAMMTNFGSQDDRRLPWPLGRKRNNNISRSAPSPSPAPRMPDLPTPMPPIDTTGLMVGVAEPKPVKVDVIEEFDFDETEDADDEPAAPSDEEAKEKPDPSIPPPASDSE